MYRPALIKHIFLRIFYVFFYILERVISMKILGIETSCDETAMAIYDTSLGLLGHELYSQVALHKLYGGVVPELASRDHLRKMPVLLNNLLEKSHCQLKDLNGIAATRGPGLVGALMVGVAFAQGLSCSLGIPWVGVHHMEGHLLAPMLETPAPEFPFVALLVSGGHTLLVWVKALGDYQILGESLDDAVGEAFDKTAKMMGLPYPGGPELAKLAEQGRAGIFNFTRPMIDRPGCDFSFSGLKTQVLMTYQRSDKSFQSSADIAYGFQETVVDTLRIKIERAMEQTQSNKLVLAGGVAANKRLRARISELAKCKNWQIFYPRPEYCTDNGAMIAYVGAMRLQRGDCSGSEISVQGRWSLADCNTPSLGPIKLM